MEEINQIMASIRDGLLFDVHRINPECQTQLKAIRAEGMPRHQNLAPAQTQRGNHARQRESRLGNQRGESLRKPRAIVNDYVDMWED